MNDPARAAVHENEVSLLALAVVVLRRWRAIAATTLGVLLLAVVVALLLPRRYGTQVLMLPSASEQPSGSSVLAEQLAGIPGIGGLAKSNQRVIGAIAESRTIRDSVVARVAGAEPPDTAAAVREILGRWTEVVEQPNGSIAVEVSGHSPRLVAAVANAFPDLINIMSAHVSEQATGRRKVFLEAQLQTARSRLDRAERRLLEFQRRSNSPDVQPAPQSVEAAVTLQGQITAKELEVDQLRRASTADNPALRSAVADLNTLRAQLRRLTGGDNRQLFVPFGEAAGMAAELTRLRREYAQEERVLQSLTAAVGEAQIELNNDLPVVTVLDSALVPTAPRGRPWALLIPVAAILGMLLGLIGAFVADFLARSAAEPDGRSFRDAWQGFKRDLRHPFASRAPAPGQVTPPR